jgi:hypothetical protein
MGYGYNYGNNLLGSTASSGLGAMIWGIIALVLSLVGCFVIYFLFVRKDVKSKSKFVLWLQEFLRFNKMLIEPIIKITYIFGALFLTLGSFALIGTSFVGFLGMLIGGNLLLRVAYEASIMLVMLWKNTTEINKKLK